MGSHDCFAAVVVQADAVGGHCVTFPVDGDAFPALAVGVDVLTSSPESKGVIIGLLNAGD